MTTQNEGKTTEQKARRHYWLREDFDELIAVIPSADVPMPGDRDASCSLVYPKSTQGAAAELKLRGLTCDEALLTRLAVEGVTNPDRGHSLVTDKEGNAGTVPSDSILSWSKEAIDRAAEWLYDNEHWDSWTHFCWVANLRFGQAVKAHRVACVKYGLGFSLSFDVPGLVTVIEPSPQSQDCAHIRFFRMGTKLVSQEKSE
jgi:hypothetical protein